MLCHKLAANTYRHFLIDAPFLTQYSNDPVNGKKTQIMNSNWFYSWLVL